MFGYIKSAALILAVTTGSSAFSMISKGKQVVDEGVAEASAQEQLIVDVGADLDQGDDLLDAAMRFLMNLL